MTLSVSNFGDAAQQPGILAEAYIPDQLIAGRLHLVSQPIVLAAGTLQRGAVLGQQTNASIQVVAGSNTGNGTIAASSLSVGAAPLTGAYLAKATSSTVFAVTDPEGNALGNATVGSAFTSTGINFTITAGGTAFVAGDSFTLSVADSVGNYVLSVKTASDGSQVPVAILADYADASGGPVTTGAYLLGEVNANALYFDPSWNVATLTTALRPYGIFVKASVSAADPVQSPLP